MKCCGDEGGDFLDDPVDVDDPGKRFGVCGDSEHLWRFLELWSAEYVNLMI